MSLKDLDNIDIMIIVRRIEKYNKYNDNAFYNKLNKQLRKLNSDITLLMIKIIRDETGFADPCDIYDLMIRLNKIELSINVDNQLYHSFNKSIKNDINKIYCGLRDCDSMKDYSDLLLSV
jgi:hypothetical protein